MFDWVVHEMMKMIGEKKVKGKNNSVKKEGRFCLFDKNLKEADVSFKTRDGVKVILKNLRGGDCNFSLIL